MSEGSESALRSDPVIGQELKDLFSRDLQLWSIVVLVVVVLALGFLALVLPNVLWNIDRLRIDQHYLPQLFSAFIFLIALFNIYLIEQKRRLNRMREKLIRNLMASSKTDGSLLDPLTQVFTRQYGESLMSKEINHAKRNGRSVTFLMIDLARFRFINNHFGALAGDHLLLVLAQLLKKTFRGSDVICRYGGDEFLVILPDTSEVQARNALRRLTTAVSAWNESTQLGYKLDLKVGVSACPAVQEPGQVLDAARHDAGRPGLVEVPV